MMRKKMIEEEKRKKKKERHQTRRTGEHRKERIIIKEPFPLLHFRFNSNTNGTCTGEKVNV